MTRARIQDAATKRARQQRAVLTRATLKAASLLDVPQATLGKVIGVSAATVTRMSQGAYELDPSRKEWDLALLFVRLYRSLDSIVGGREADAQAWLHSNNTALESRPIDLLLQVTGLVRVVDYLDAARARS